HAEAPEEVVGPLEAFGWVALAPEEEVFPRIVGGDAWNAGELALVRDRNDSVAGRRADHDVDLVAVDELRGDFRRPVGVRLAVAIDDLDRMLLARDGDAWRQNLAGFGEHPLIGLAEGGDRPGSRANHSDLDGTTRGTRRGEQPGRSEGTGGADPHGLDDLAA